MTTFNVSNKDLVNLFNEYDIEFVEYKEYLIVKWGIGSAVGYSLVGIKDGFLACLSLYQLVENIINRNELLHTLKFSSDFYSFNKCDLDADNTLCLGSSLCVKYGVSEMTVIAFLEEFFINLIDAERKLEELGIDFVNLSEVMYDEILSEN